MLATVVALEISNGVSARSQRGWGKDNDMWEGLKYVMDGKREASPLSLSSHHDITLDLQVLFQDSLLGGDCMIIRGSDREYW